MKTKTPGSVGFPVGPQTYAVTREEIDAEGNYSCFVVAWNHDLPAGGA